MRSRSGSVGVLDAPCPAADDLTGWEVRLAALEGLSRTVAAEKAKAQVSLAAAVTRLHPDSAEFAPASVAVAQGVSPGSASRALAWAEPLVEVLPETFELLRDGEITLGLAREVARRCRDLGPEQAVHVEARAWERGRDRSFTQVVRRVREEVALLALRDPAQAGPAEGRDSRDVWLTPGRPGTDTVEVHARVTTIDGHAAIAALDAGYDSADPRPRAVQRADTLVETLTGETSFAHWADSVDADPDVTGHDDREVPGCARHWSVEVSVPLDVVITGGGVAGFGPDVVTGLTGRMVALLALRAGGRVTRLVTDPLSGQLRDVTLVGRSGPPGAQHGERPPRPAIADVIEPQYEPSAALDRYVRVRDRRCQHPGCRVPARRCDIDHIDPYDKDEPELGGQTTARNLVCVCRHHHRLKHSQGWSLSRLRDGTLRWTSPSGQIHDVGPPEHRGAA